MFNRTVIVWLLGCCLVLPTTFAFSQTQQPGELAALTLTDAQIKKLDKLFQISEVPDTENPSREHVVWKDVPIPLVLPINKEKMVTFPSAVEFGYDKTLLPDDILRVQNNNGTLYLMAKQSFATQRVAVKLSSSGKIILIDVSVQQDANATPVDVVLAPDEVTPTDVSHDSLTSEVSYVTLTRFAVQQLYAPTRLISPVKSIYRVPMRTPKTISLWRDGSVIAMPLASWRSGGMTITAVLLRNALTQSITLDPRELCGSWQTAAFYPSDQLSPTSSTTVFLVTQQSFHQALEGCL